MCIVPVSITQLVVNLKTVEEPFKILEAPRAPSMRLQDLSVKGRSYKIRVLHNLTKTRSCLVLQIEGRTPKKIQNCPNFKLY